jgi:hypothetical protein
VPNRGQVILAVRVLEVRQPRRPFLGEIHPAPE